MTATAPAQELRQLTGELDAARRALAAVQQQIDAMPERPDGEDDGDDRDAWDFQRDELLAERDRASEAARAAEDRVRQARGLAAAADANRLDAEVRDQLAALERHSATVAEDVAALPCNGYRQTAEEALAAKDASKAARAYIMGDRACGEAKAWKTCGYATAGWCPRQHATALYETIERNIRDGRIPGKQRRLLRDHFARRDRKPLDPKAFDAFNVAEAVYSRKPLDVGTLAGLVRLRGDETIVVFYGPTGRGKTVAATYLIARWGGLYMTAYELAGVGMDPMCPTRGQMLAAPVLVIDQTGRQHRGPADYASSMLEWVVDARYSEERLTVIVGNYDTIDTFEADADDVIASRIAEVGVYVQCYGEDARRAPAGAPEAGRR